MRDQVLHWRDRLLADRRFQRWAARFPLTRPIARRNTRALFDLCAGFIYAQTLAACVELDLFTLLAAGPLTPAELAARCGLTGEGAASLIAAATALDLLAPRAHGRTGLGTLGAAMCGNPGIAAMVRHHAMLYADLRDPVAVLRSPRGHTALASYWPYAGTRNAESLRADQVHGYTALMAASQPMVADEVLAVYDFRRHRTLLDVGGGDGSFVAAVAARAPGLHLMVYDLPAVAERATANLAHLGLAARATCIGGSFTSGALPAGADIISFVRVLHDHDDTEVHRLLTAARAALPRDGAVLIAEPMADTPQATAYFSMYLHAMGSGRPRSPATLTGMLRAAGFSAPRLLRTPTPLLTSVLVAQRAVNPS